MQNQYRTIRLKNNEDRRIKAGHLWVYSNEIDAVATPLKKFNVGEIVRIQNNRDEILGVGYVNPNTLLAVRILSREAKQIIDENYLQWRLQNALNLREAIFAKPFYRLIFGESDFLPGLIVDRYDGVLVAQITTAGMENLREEIATVLKKLIQPKALLWRNDTSARELEGLKKYIEPAFGDIPEQVELSENDVKFIAPIQSGQKTGWFYDHRDNRAKLKRYVKDKRVLDVFTYLGGWGIQAATFGAKEVTCIDSSAPALALLEKNAELNQVQDKVKMIVGDAFDVLKDLTKHEEKFDVIILDPPAFIKKRKDEKEGLIAYLRANELAVQLLNKGGILVTSSCSMHLSMEMLTDITRRVAAKTGRNIQILEAGQQAPDHPIHPAIPETAYLKTLICRVL